ncbi:tripartite tricarboxylate transporter substrate-binding protein [Humitalea sp. 24SJ18S-53]|uniref:tripartite tricarboxylate transporter substrate-binding protein n=1 Tax=Humitalea sp. 24SJ18S-53 TaxID=3422307 RepID=UPI003D67D6B5
MIRRAILAPTFLALTLLAGPAMAQRFPDRPITITVPFTAGGPTDTIARLTAEAMARDLGSPVVVENVTGAGGTIAAGRIAQARPDGHSLLIHHIGMATTATLYRRLAFDVQTSFVPLGLVSDAAMTIVTRPDFPAEDLAGLVGVMRARKDALNLGHSGLGGANQLCGMLLQQAAGAQLTTIVYRGSAPAITELMAGRLDVFCDQATNTVPYLADRRIRGYAVSTMARVPGIDLPTANEAGLSGFEMSTWHGLYAPRGTPPEVVARLNTAIRAAMRDERLRARFGELQTQVATEAQADPAYHARFLAAEVAKWRVAIQAAGEYAD